MSMKSERSLIALFPLAAYGRASYARTDHLCHPEGAYPRRGAAATRARRDRAFGRVFRQEKQGVSFWDKPAAHLADPRARDRKSVVSGKSVSVRVDLGGRRHIKKKT